MSALIVSLMGVRHVADDAVIGNWSLLKPTAKALIVGYVRVGDRAKSLGTRVHQFCRIGDVAMVGAGCVITEDMLAFTVSLRNANRLPG